VSDATSGINGAVSSAMSDAKGAVDKAANTMRQVGTAVTRASALGG
jgi:hypothetical protein